MKKSLLIIVLFFASLTAFSQVSVSGYYRSNGTYVQPHQRTMPNHTINDNYSTKGNINPYTGKVGTVPRMSYSSSSTYSAPARTYSTLTYTAPRTYSTPTYSAPKTYSTPTYSAPRSYSTPSYNTSRTIYTGSRGGQYYINSNGNKTYVPRY